MTSLGLALGTSVVSLLELTRSYAVFAAQGRQVAPRFTVAPEGQCGRALALCLYETAPAAPCRSFAPRAGYTRSCDPGAVTGGQHSVAILPVSPFNAMDQRRRPPQRAELHRPLRPGGRPITWET